jgi:hypothetical protein
MVTIYPGAICSSFLFRQEFFWLPVLRDACFRGGAFSINIRSLVIPLQPGIQFFQVFMDVHFPWHDANEILIDNLFHGHGGIQPFREALANRNPGGSGLVSTQSRRVKGDHNSCVSGLDPRQLMDDEGLCLFNVLELFRFSDLPTDAQGQETVRIPGSSSSLSMRRGWGAAFPFRMKAIPAASAAIRSFSMSPT